MPKDTFSCSVHPPWPLDKSPLLQGWNTNITFQTTIMPSIRLPISRLIGSDPLDKAPFSQHGNGIVNGRPAEMADNHQLRFGDVWVVPYLSQDSGLGIVQGFITHFITHLIDEVEWDGDGDVVVGEVKSPFYIIFGERREFLCASVVNKKPMDSRFFLFPAKSPQEVGDKSDTEQSETMIQLNLYFPLPLPFTGSTAWISERYFM
mgnify:CR=1 FL=1